MKRFSVLSVAVILSLVLSLAAAMPVNAGQGNDDKVRVLVEFAPGHKGDMENALNGMGAEFHFAFDDLNTFAVSVPAQALNGLQHNPNVVSIEEDAIRYPISIMPSQNAAPAAVSLPEQVVPYGVDMVQARDVWDADRDGTVDTGAPTGAGIKVCIIDSGIYTGHEDLNGVNASGYTGNLPWNVDGSGHGTHVSGTIAAMNNALGVLGVTPGTVSIYMVRVFGDDGAWAYSSTLVDAANRCKDAGANIISMSLGGSKSNRTEQNTFNTLYNTYGILSIAAAGNEGTSALSYPASYTSVVSVAAIDEHQSLGRLLPIQQRSGSGCPRRGRAQHRALHRQFLDHRGRRDLRRCPVGIRALWFSQRRIGRWRPVHRQRRVERQGRPLPARGYQLLRKIHERLQWRRRRGGDLQQRPRRIQRHVGRSSLRHRCPASPSARKTA